MNDQPAPSPALADQYQVIGVQPGTVLLPSGSYVDLRTVDLATAERLHAAGFPYLAKVETGAAPAPAAEPEPTQEPETAQEPEPTQEPAHKPRKRGA